MGVVVKARLTMQQRIEIRRRIIEERKKGRAKIGGSQVMGLMRRLALEHGVSYGCISRTVYG